MSLPRVASRPAWDERRNTSATRGVDPRALELALRACAAFHAADPAHTSWLRDGAPPIRSDAEHLARFGVPYTSKLRRVK